MGGARRGEAARGHDGDCRARRLERSGPARHCLGTALVDWHVKGGDGSTKASGTNVFQLDHDGRIAAITGLWN